MIVFVEQLAERVRHGAALLDAKRPDWFREVPITKLDMEVGYASAWDPSGAPRCGCVGVWMDYATKRSGSGYSYPTGLHRLGVRALVKGGFERGERDVLEGEVGVPHEQSQFYQILTSLWADEIRKRRRSAAQVVTR